MIATATEYACARTELASLDNRLSDLLRTHPLGEKGFMKAGVRKMIARLHEELAVFESSEAVKITT